MRKLVITLALTFALSSCLTINVWNEGEDPYHQIPAHIDETGEVIECH